MSWYKKAQVTLAPEPEVQETQEWQEVPVVKTPRKGEDKINATLEEFVENLGHEAWVEKNFWKRKAYRGVYAFLREHYNEILDRSLTLSASSKS